MVWKSLGMCLLRSLVASFFSPIAIWLTLRAKFYGANRLSWRANCYENVDCNDQIAITWLRMVVERYISSNDNYDNVKALAIEFHF